MALNAARMAKKIREHQAQLNFKQVADESQAEKFALKSLQAFCQGIIDEIHSGAEVETTSGAPDGEHTGIIK